MFFLVCINSKPIQYIELHTFDLFPTTIFTITQLMSSVKIIIIIGVGAEVGVVLMIVVIEEDIV